MADQNLRGFLGSQYKSYSHGSSSLRSTKQNLIIDLQILTQRLKQRFRLYEDPMSMENFMEGIGKYKIKDKKYDFYEETL